MLPMCPVAESPNYTPWEQQRHLSMLWITFSGAASAVPWLGAPVHSNSQPSLSRPCALPVLLGAPDHSKANLFL